MPSMNDRLPTVDECLDAYKEAWRQHLSGPLNHKRADYVKAFEALQAARKREGRPWSPEDYA